jgi:hypothetical protein
MPTYLGDLVTCEVMRSCPECQKRYNTPQSFFTSTNVTIIALLIVIGMLLVKLK